MLTAKDRTHFPSGGYGGLYNVGPSPDYCALTMKLGGTTLEAAAPGPTCDQLTAPSPVEAELWNGQVVAVRTAAITVTTYFDPSFAVYSGLVRMIGLVPLAILIAMIEIDLAHHRFFQRVQHRRLSSSR